MASQALRCLHEVFTTTLPAAKVGSAGPGCLAALLARSASEKRFLRDAALKAMLALIRGEAGADLLAAILPSAASKHAGVAAAAGHAMAACVMRWKATSPGDMAAALSPHPTPLMTAFLSAAASLLTGRSVEGKRHARAAVRGVAAALPSHPTTVSAQQGEGRLTPTDASALRSCIGPARSKPASAAPKPWLRKAPAPAPPTHPPTPPPPKAARELRCLDINAVLPLATPAKAAFASRRVTRAVFAAVGKGE